MQCAAAHDDRGGDASAFAGMDFVALVDGARDGDGGMWDELCDRLTPALLGVVERADRHTAAEMLHRCFGQALRAVRADGLSADDLATYLRVSVRAGLPARERADRRSTDIEDRAAYARVRRALSRVNAADELAQRDVTDCLKPQPSH